MEKFTKLPWETAYIEERGKRRPCIFGDGKLIAVLQRHDNVFYNLDLIAEAPRMYDALKDFLEIYEENLGSERLMYKEIQEFVYRIRRMQIMEKASGKLQADILTNNEIIGE